ncbi:type VII secretion protein EccCb [Streptomyces sp. A7024]|uniref:Type VII secretion protein EccCb n=1 Tax=Streptomyces coryli TaxID=1128680 RepID=A0A6G4TU85_9ACTN|nr:type VII secretion protein EccCb [Streptomyces coryli]NGN63434.1 type VII secretion protein EccCb [Streptomyces coryli]
MAGRRIALLIATDGYADPGLSKLRTPTRSAHELEAILLDEAVGRFDLVRTLTNRPKEEIEREIEELLSDRSPEDLVLLYFACHGIRNDTDRLFFATTGTDLKRPHTTAVRADFIHQLLDESDARSKVILLDCCYSGLFHRGIPMSDSAVDVNSALGGRGTFVVTAATALEYAYEGDQLTMNQARPGGSRFTAAVIEGLSTGHADLDGDGFITPDDLYTYVHDAVVNQSGPEQTPTKSGQCEGQVTLAYAARPGGPGGPVSGALRTDELLLGDLLPPPVDTMDRGFICDAWEGASRLLVPIGRLAAGFGGTPVCLDLSGREGNAGIVGRLGSGKTTLLRSAIMSLALTHTPHEVEFYLLEGAVNRLGALRSTPHIKGIAAAHEGAKVAEILSALKHELDARRAMFRDLDIDSVEEFRERRASEGLAWDRGTDVFLVVDGWLDFHWEIEGFADEVQRLINAGLNYGVHLIVSARRWSDVDADLRSLLGARIELPLDDPQTSLIDTGLAANVGVGWALMHGRRIRVAVPQLEPVTGPVQARQALVDLTRRMRDRWSEHATESAPGRAPDNPSFTELLGLGDPAEIDPARTWRPLPPAERLRVPIGVAEDGSPVVLDLKEAALEGMGPHGLCVGATGTGKSELLRALVLGLAATHSPETLNFILADFKGGATFAGMSHLPHVAAVLTNLSDDLTLVDRMEEAVAGELARRQELLRAAGNFANIQDYQRACDAAEPLTPLPTLVLVIDEFDEMQSARPAFIDMFIQIGRIGRSLGVHLLLASQRLEEGKLRGLDTYLSYRIAFRTFSAAESRTAIGVPDAYHLPSLPGSGYLTYGSDERVRFRAPYVSGVYRAPDLAPPTPDPDFVLAQPRTIFGPPSGATMPPLPPGYDVVVHGDSLLDVIVQRLEGAGPPAHQVWLPPLDAPPSLDELLPGLEVMEGRGLAAPHAPRGRLTVPLGLIDKPFEQRRDGLWLDFSAAAGHMQLIGGPQSGKSTLLRTLIAAFALTHTPEEVQFYGLDFGGGGMSAMAGLPHMGGVASRLEPELVQRTVIEVQGILNRREKFFHARGIDSIGTFRRLRARGEIDVQDHPWGDVFLVIDGWKTFRTDYEDLDPIVTDIAARGLGFGIHVIIAAARPIEVRSALKDHLGNRLELRLGDPMDSEFDRKVAVNVPAGLPGRGLTPQRQHFLAAVPRIDGLTSSDDLPHATALLCQKAAEAWHGPAAPRVRLLPRVLPAAELPRGDAQPERGIAFGIDETNLEPVFADFEREPFFLVLGDDECGKTNLLKLLTQQLTARYDEDELVLAVFDPRRGLRGTVPDSYLGGYAHNPKLAAGLAGGIAGELEKRLPGAEDLNAGPGEFSGPRVVILVDDYDILTTAGQRPLESFLPYIPVAGDIGLHFVVTRRVAGSSRAMYEPFLAGLRESGATALVMAGERGEGQLFPGLYPSHQPPGRGSLVRRGRSPQLIQTALAD